MPEDRKQIIDFVTIWHQILREDLQWRLGALDKDWATSHELCRNSRGGIRRGNVVADFVTNLVSRFLSKQWDITVRPHSPKHASHAKDFETLATVLGETTNLLDRTQQVALNATWGAGWLYVGHPLDPYCLFPDKRMNAPDATLGAGAATPDEWQEVSPEELTDFGLDASELETLPPEMANLLDRPEKADPKPILPVDFGLPWSKVIDPRYVIHSKNAKDVEDCEYLAVLHFLTKKELELIFDRLPDYLPLHSEVKSLWAEVEGKNPALYPELTCIVEVYLRTVKNDPHYSWYRFAYPYGAPESYLYFVPNNHGKFVPLSSLRLNPIAMLWDATIAMSLSDTAQQLDRVHQAIDISIEREMRLKYLLAQSGGLDQEEEKKLFNEEYEGTIRLNDPNSLRRLEGQFNEQLLRAAMYYRTMAQARSGQSDLDRGTAIKGITARQTDVLVEASGLNMGSMGSQISKFVSSAVFKLVYLLTRYGPVGRAADLNYGRMALLFERGGQELSAALLYRVTIRDTGRDPTVEEQLSFNQAIRTLSTGFGIEIARRLDPAYFAREFLAVYGKGPEGLAGVPESGPAMPGAQVSAPGGGGPGAGMVEALAQGQHPERGPGDRGGVDGANLMAGLANIGMGTGEP